MSSFIFIFLIKIRSLKLFLFLKHRRIICFFSFYFLLILIYIFFFKRRYFISCESNTSWIMTHNNFFIDLLIISLDILFNTIHPLSNF